MGYSGLADLKNDTKWVCMGMLLCKGHLELSEQIENLDLYLKLIIQRKVEGEKEMQKVEHQRCSGYKQLKSYRLLGSNNC